MSAPSAASSITSSPSESKRGVWPTVFVSHGGGPSFFMELSESPFLEGIHKGSDASKSLEKLLSLPQLRFSDAPPAAIVVFSAHWESHTDNEVWITSQDTHKELYYDYGGFPSWTYNLDWNSKGSPSVAATISTLLQKSGFKTKLDTRRNFDHGVFVPMKLILPKPTVPILQVSLLGSLSAEQHLRIGEALSSLRSRDGANILFIGSGFATHAIGAKLPQAKEFVTALDKALNLPGDERRKALVEWFKMPGARVMHSPEDHLLPLHMVVGAAGAEAKSTKLIEVPLKSMGGYFINWIFE